MKLPLTIILVILGNLASAQERNPVHWRIHSTKNSDGKYEVYFSAIIDPPWHIYAQNNDSDVAMPTSISFKANPSVELIDKPKEIGSLKVDSVLGTVVRYYENEVDFVQTIKLQSTGKTTISGTISWMACTQQCLPEADQHFSLRIGGD
jgi:DsbC/DsbD-like thiol-disulfide interchange protein